MLRTLTIRHIALIDTIKIDFSDGFSVLTGETGAGKSIIIEALNFVLGERASREMIQTGADRASVEAEFEISPDEPVREVLLEQALMEPEDSFLTLFRELTDSGRNTCRVNGTLVSAAVLKQIGDRLVDIHGQHAHQALLNEKLHLSILDGFAGEEIQEPAGRVRLAFQAASEALKKLNGAQMDERERMRRCDLLSYQIREIDAARLVEGEEEDLSERRRVLQHAQTIQEALAAAHEAVTGDEGALSPLFAASRAMGTIASLSGDYQSASERLSSAYYELEDIGYLLRDLERDFSYDPEELDRIETRLEEISGLKRKYGESIPEILKYRKNIGEEYEDLIGNETRQEQLRESYAAARKEYDAACAVLRGIRERTAERLRSGLLPHLRDLGMPGADFEVRFVPLDGELPSGHGKETAEFLLTANRGEPVRPLSKVASGGELSRIMLAMKSVLADAGDVPTMVFDEIDTGISGQIGNALAGKMHQIARDHQVLCITHLPQVAACADTEYLVFKEETDGRSRSGIRRLTEEERPAEIARIMGSAPDDAVAIEHARNLILSARKNTARKKESKK